jgi:hypothetical protein
MAVGRLRHQDDPLAEPGLQLGGEVLADDDRGLVGAREVAAGEHLPRQVRDLALGARQDADQGHRAGAVFTLDDGGDAHAGRPGRNRGAVQHRLERARWGGHAAGDARVVHIAGRVDLPLAGQKT